MGSQWEFYKIARKSAVSITSQAITLIKEQLDRVVYFYGKSSMGTQVWILTQPVLSLTMTKDNP